MFNSCPDVSENKQAVYKKRFSYVEFDMNTGSKMLLINQLLGGISYL